MPTATVLSSSSTNVATLIWGAAIVRAGLVFAGGVMVWSVAVGVPVRVSPVAVRIGVKLTP